MIAAVSRKFQVLLINSWQLTKDSLKEQFSSCSLPYPFWSEIKEQLQVSGKAEKAESGIDRPRVMLFS